ncbi:Glyoxalase-like domain-containing protein [Siphonobacter aquaeclarae]|jgi:catechol 2,3-dioxygenase-like lactoylglutathione lyase family enzyme|uniref:Bleomycin resistance protein n=2 Tax=Siphonobacter aquaeclarae TaxID=563176 RepID=A0A1G9RG17_9BACT|nr:VOC family protein [Siphonobacter aquaeclarae]SDM22272.1 Glyoxalase-like domain-containing protein [Siphonobacter aquaeclarae]
MKIIPVFTVQNMKRAVAFYTEILDFECWGTWPEDTDPAYGVLFRDGAELHLSSYQGGGFQSGCAYAAVNDVDALFRLFLSRGLDTSAKPDSPVHQGPVDQTWGNREFYVDDPDGNRLCFGRRAS